MVALEETIADNNIDALIDEDIQAGTQELLQLVGSTDGLQLTNDRRGNHRHFANSMFNIMRGGIFDDNYTIEKQDFLPYIQNANKKVYQSKEQLLNKLDDRFDLAALIELAAADKDADFSRLCFEYLPLVQSPAWGP